MSSSPVTRWFRGLRTGRGPDRRATGGGARSQAWLQIVADVFGTRVVTLKEPEAAAYGAALQAVWNWRLAAGETCDIAAITERWVTKGKLAAEPAPETTKVYGDLQGRFNDLWRRLVPDFEARRSMTARSVPKLGRKGV